MSLTQEQVEHIAMLARLQLSEKEKVRYRQQLSQILDYAARLQELDTSGILPTASVMTPRSMLRDDVSRPGMSLEQLMANAPEISDEQFRVPPILEEAS